jgi:hypothetical protein
LKPKWQIHLMFFLLTLLSGQIPALWFLAPRCRLILYKKDSDFLKFQI